MNGNWTEHEINVLKVAIANSGHSIETCEAVARATGRTWKAVWNKAKRMELIDNNQSQETVTVGTDNCVDAIHKFLRTNQATISEVADKFDVSPKRVQAAIDELKSRSVNVCEIGGKWSIEKQQIPSFIEGPRFEFVSRPDNTFLFGAVGDTHMGSKYARLDVISDLYDIFERSGVDRVYHGGNWIDGEARFNKHDLIAHGMGNQCQYLVDNYPSRKGITTYAVTGDDHEGWYAQREGVDIGKYQESVMRDNGREDWINLGYMESHIRLINANSGVEAIMAVTHPGGGSAYADSYKPQKIIESLEGGEKPAVLIYGHYHKMLKQHTRNVWCIGVGCCQDQTPFARKKQLRFDIGGVLVKLKQDPETGAIVMCGDEMYHYFNRGFYNNRWSHSGPVTLPKRKLGQAA